MNVCILDVCILSDLCYLMMMIYIDDFIYTDTLVMFDTSSYGFDLPHFHKFFLKEVLSGLSL